METLLSPGRESIVPALSMAQPVPGTPPEGGSRQGRRVRAKDAPWMKCVPGTSSECGVETCSAFWPVRSPPIEGASLSGNDLGK